MRKIFFPAAVTLVVALGALALHHAPGLPENSAVTVAPSNGLALAQPVQVKTHNATRQSRPSIPAEPMEMANFGLRVPLEFEANRGQAPERYSYVAHGPSYSLGLSAGEIALSLHRPESRSNRNLADIEAASAHAELSSEALSEFRLRLVGASPSARVGGLDPKPGRSNYFIGNDPAKWQTDVPHFGKVKIAALYPGIDLVFYGNPHQLEYDFLVAPGADPNAIRVVADGATSTAVDRDGNLILGTPAGEVQLKHPDAYQEIDGNRHQVESDFELAADNSVQFRVSEYDRSQPLIIDPVLLYGVSIGGSNGNRGVAVDVDAAGNAYLTGNTCSIDFPSTAGNFQTIHSNPALQKCYDTFVVKLDPTASSILYSDYIGGSSTQSGAGIAVDGAGVAYVTGLTTSTNFPLVNNIGPSAPVPCNFSSIGYSCPDAFILKLSADGSQLLFSSLLGGNQASSGLAVKLNSVTGDLLVLGSTNSSNFSPAPTTLETTYPGATCLNGIRCFASFLVGLNPATGAFRYGTYFSGAGSTFLTGMSVDAGGDIYVSGSAVPPLSSSLGTVTNTYAPTGATAAGTDIVVARLHPSAGSLSTAYLTLVQGEADESAAGIAVDASQNAYITGSSASLHLPITASAFQANTVSKSNYDCGWLGQLDLVAPKDFGTGFVGKLTPNGSLSFLTYLGGSTGQDAVDAIAVDSLGNIWVTGDSGSSDFPFSTDGYSTGSFVSFNRPFLAKMTNDGSQLPFATAVAGVAGTSTGLKVDSNNNVYVVGAASNSLTTPNVYQSDSLSYNPIFVEKWGPGGQPTLKLSSTSVTFPTVPLGGISPPQTVTVQNTGAAPLELGIGIVPAQSQPILPSGFQESDNCGTTLAAGASCTITTAFEPAPPVPGCATANNGCSATSPAASILIQNNAAAGPQTIALNGTTGHGAAVSVSPNPIVFGPQAAGTTSAPLYVEVQNQGDTSLTVSNATIGGANAADFKITSIGTCNNTAALGLIGCNLYVAFSPAVSSTGTRTASLILTDNAGDSPQTIPMSGVVTGPGAGLSVTPGPLFLGIAAIGAASSSSQANVTFTNTSTNTAVQVTSLTLGGTNAADFSVTRGSCSSTPPFTLAAGGACFVVVNFLPTGGSHGLRTATLTPATNPVVSGLPVIALSASAVTNTDPSLSLVSVPAPQDFGSIQVGQSSYAGQNLLSIATKSPIPCAAGAPTCGGPLTISSFATGLPDYTVVTQNSQPYCTNPPLTIPSGGYGCTFQIIFSPTASGNRNTTLAINSNDPMGPTIVPLFGSGLALPLGNLSATQLNFGPSAIGVASPPLSVTLQNIGEANLSVAGAIASANFSVASNNCPATLAPNATCIIGVSFTPPSAGPFTGTLTISDNGYYGAQQTVVLNGTGATGPLLRLSSTSFNFGTQAINTLSAAQTLTLTNTGDTVITFPTGALRISGDFRIQNTSCGSALALGASCIVNLQFNPSVTYYDTASLILTDNARGNPQEVVLAGTGTTADGTPTVTLTSSANPAASGLPVTFTATVAGASAGLPVPTGTVTFSDSFNSLGTATLNSSGQASITTSALLTGNHFVNARYSGSSVYASASSSVLTEVVNAASNTPTTTTVASSVNPSAYGQTVVFTATITGTGGNSPTPTGNVIFLDGTTTIGTVPLNGAAQALLASGSLSIGSHTITAMYVGNANYAASTSAVVTQNVAASAGVATTTSLVSSANPSSSGQVVVYTASVAGTGGNPSVPTGTVTFMNGTTMLGTVILNGSAQAAFGSASLSPGSYSITAIYSGDANFAGSSSTPLVQVATSPPYIWIANGNSTLSKISAGVIPFSPPGGYSGGGLGLAIDGFGNVWSGSNGSVTMLNSVGAGSKSFSGGGIAGPASIAIAGDGSVWIANANSTIAVLANNGTPQSPATGFSGGGLNTPTGLAIDSSGNVWVTNSGDSSLTEFVGAAPPVTTPLASAVKNGNQGGRP